MRGWWGKTGVAVMALAAMTAGARAQANPELVIDMRSGTVLHAQNATHPWFPASLTKLLTTYVALEAVQAGRVRMDTPFIYSARASKERPSKMGFKVGTRVTLDNALKMLMVKSANDIAVVIAEGIGGSVEGFAVMMNDAARRIGMSQSHFVNPHGWFSPDQFTTARDMALLARALILNFPDQHGLFSLPGIRLGKTVMRNHNTLIGRYAGATGMKTGFTCPSGFNLVGTAARGNQYLIAVVLGSPSSRERGEQTAELLERGFEGRRGPMAGQGIMALPAVNAMPPDMRPVICAPRKEKIVGENAAVNEEGEGESALAALVNTPQRRVLLDPRPAHTRAVDVFIGAPAAGAGKGAGSGVPLPLSRPGAAPVALPQIQTEPAAPLDLRGGIAAPVPASVVPAGVAPQRPRPMPVP